MGDFWQALRDSTPSRIGLGRAGDATSTRAVLEAGAAHALARDAVHLPLEVDALVADLAPLTDRPVLRVASAAPDRATYLTRPDLGRRLAEDTELPRRTRDDPDDLDGPGEPDLAVVMADGLSASGVRAHAVPLLRALVPLLDAGTRLAPFTVATQARVAIGDQIGAALDARMLLVLIGERPGLSASDSLGAYLTWAPGPGIADSARNCVSNIRPPHGLTYDAAARTLASLIVGARQLGATGVRLKDVGGELAG